MIHQFEKLQEIARLLSLAGRIPGLRLIGTSHSSVVQMPSCRLFELKNHELLFLQAYAQLDLGPFHMLNRKCFSIAQLIADFGFVSDPSFLYPSYHLYWTTADLDNLTGRHCY